MSERRASLRVAVPPPRHRVEQGAALLDAATPGWAAAVTKRLYAPHGVLAQVYGTDAAAWPVTEQDAATFGFKTDDPNETDELLRCWEQAVASRNSRSGTPVGNLHVIGVGGLAIINGSVGGRTALTVPQVTEQQITFTILRWFDDQQEAMDVAAAVVVLAEDEEGSSNE